MSKTPLIPCRGSALGVPLEVESYVMDHLSLLYNPAPVYAGDTMRTELEVLHKQLAQVCKKIYDMRQSHSRDNADLQAEVRRLEGELARSEASRKASEIALKASETALSVASDELGRLHAVIDDLEGQVFKSTKDKEEAQQKWQEAKKKLEEWDAKAEKLTEEAERSLGAVVTKAAEARAYFDAEMGNMKRKLESAHAGETLDWGRLVTCPSFIPVRNALASRLLEGVKKFIRDADPTFDFSIFDRRPADPGL